MSVQVWQATGARQTVALRRHPGRSVVARDQPVTTMDHLHAEQQVQRYEAAGYRSASLARLCDVAAALNVTITERASLRGPGAA